MKGLKPAWREAQVSFQQSLKFEERLFVENYVVQLVGPDSPFSKTVSYRLLREARIVLFAATAFLLGCGYDSAVFDQRRRAVMLEG